MNQSTPYGQMPTALEALRALVIEFDSYAEDMRAIGRGHADYGLQRRLAHMVLHAAETPTRDPIALEAPAVLEAPAAAGYIMLEGSDQPVFVLACGHVPDDSGRCHGCEAPEPPAVLEAEPPAVLEAPKTPIARSSARKPKPVKAPKPEPAPVVLADLKRDELYAHFKKTAPIADLTFFLNATADTIAEADVERAEGLAALFDATGKLTINRAEYYRRLVTLQDHWRQGAARRWALERAGERTAALWADARHMDALTVREAAALALETSAARWADARALDASALEAA